MLMDKIALVLIELLFVHTGKSDFIFLFDFVMINEKFQNSKLNYKNPELPKSRSFRYAKKFFQVISS